MIKGSTGSTTLSQAVPQKVVLPVLYTSIFSVIFTLGVLETILVGSQPGDRDQCCYCRPVDCGLSHTICHLGIVRWFIIRLVWSSKDDSDWYFVLSNSSPWRYTCSFLRAACAKVYSNSF
ncbi:MAG: hypothetical protein A2Z14_11200 [Chloroflexi bacterium RBG_16_48_8]|nr:MAG: hypothetical protein A2Z14_11200 [Chloroflexi bacterium RBG_16_48_8]